ncbi:unnamed protein product, partial [Symbiodinium sp. CCMP2456]
MADGRHAERQLVDANHGLTSLRRRGRWRQAAHAFCTLRHRTLRPNVFSYSIAISAH